MMKVSADNINAYSTEQAKASEESIQYRTVIVVSSGTVST